MSLIYAKSKHSQFWNTNLVPRIDVRFWFILRQIFAGIVDSAPETCCAKSIEHLYSDKLDDLKSSISTPVNKAKMSKKNMFVHVC